MKVSFILPAFKRRFLKEAIASILAQTYREFELVVVDDCSPENLKEVVDEFQDERLSYHRNAENLGGKDLVAAWEHAMTFATGEWCVLASDDDVYSPRFLEAMVAAHNRHPAVDLVHCRVRVIDGEGCEKCVTPEKPEVESAIELMHARIVGHADQYVPEFMFRRVALEAVGGFVDFPKAWYSDEATWGLLARNGCANVNEPYFFFRYSGINISTSYQKVYELIEAGWQYYCWAKPFLEGLETENSREEGLLAETQAHLEGRVVGLISWEMHSTTYREWFIVLFFSRIPLRWRYLCLKDALRERLKKWGRRR